MRRSYEKCNRFFRFFGHWPSAGSFGILNTIRNSEELREGAIEQLEKARARYGK
uniref:Uncharacterized protein n=1 Tax=Helianthus annuus TaxID=4232 RepID=A0A1Y3BUC0_HELAN